MSEKLTRILVLKARDIASANFKIKSQFVGKNNIPDEKLKGVLNDSMLKRFMLGKGYINPVEIDDQNEYVEELVTVQTGDYENYSYKKYDKNKVIDQFDKDEIVNRLYNEGFKLNGKKYVRCTRTTGASREGKCFFVLEDHANEIQAWNCAGLDIDSKSVQDNLASFEAYRALTLSSIMGVIKIKPENILVVRDVELSFEDEVINVRDENEKIIAKREKTVITNNIFDGEGLLDESMFKDEYRGKGMLLLRNHFFKCCVFNTKLQKWLKERGLEFAQDLNGNIMADVKIKDIKMVVTESSIKYLKFFDTTGKNFDVAVNKWREVISSEFGVVKTDKPTNYFDGKLVRTSYQMINTLQLDASKIKELYKPTVDYYNQIISNNEVLLNQLDPNASFELDEYNENDDDSELADDFTYSFNYRLMLTLLRLNPDFSGTCLFRKIVKNYSNSLRKQMKNGQILVSGTNATLFGNGYELLNHIVKKKYFDKFEPLLSGNEVYCKFFEDGKELMCARSPHITMGNLLISKNKVVPEYDKYFNLTNEIICVNSVNFNILERLNNCDFDSDVMLVTDNKIMLDAAKKNYGRFLVPVNNISGTKVSNTNTAEIDSKNQQSQIGRIVNLSQKLNSILWDKLNENPNANIDDLYNDISILAILSGVAIDSAKRSFPFEINEVVEYLDKEKYKDYPVPAFMKGKAEVYYKSAMDILSLNFDNLGLNKSKWRKKYDLKDIFGAVPSGGTNHITDRFVPRLIQVVAKYKSTLFKMLTAKKNKQTASYYQIWLLETVSEAREEMGKYLNNEYAIYLALRQADEFIAGTNKTANTVLNEKQGKKNKLRILPAEMILYYIINTEGRNIFISKCKADESKKYCELVLSENDTPDYTFYGIGYDRKKVFMDYNGATIGDYLAYQDEEELEVDYYMD